MLRIFTRALACSALALPSMAAFSQSAASACRGSDVRIVAGGYVDGITAHPRQRGLFYARTGNAYRYNAQTSIWTPLNAGTPPENVQWMGVNSIAIDPSNPNMFYLATGLYTASWAAIDGMLVSYDQAAHFIAHPLGFRQSSGWSWSRVDASTTSAANSIGFGKAAMGKHYPTSYLAGTVNGVTGLFRFNDVGDPHSFGTVHMARTARAASSAGSPTGDAPRRAATPGSFAHVKQRGTCLEQT